MVVSPVVPSGAGAGAVAGSVAGSVSGDGAGASAVPGEGIGSPFVSCVATYSSIKGSSLASPSM